MTVRADGLMRRYGERTALADVSFALPAGQTLVVLGANGAGKTTLLRILATLLRPHGGTVSVLDHNLPADAWAARGQIGLVTHEPILYRGLTARENLTFAARLHDVPQTRIDELLDAADIAVRADEPTANLSKGMLQRVSVCQALISDPQLLLLDEPRANLDPHAANMLEPLIGRASGRTRVLVTHDADWGRSEADLILGLKDGRQVFCGPAADFDDAELRELYE